MLANENSKQPTNDLPEDLSAVAIKAARRLQALARGRLHVVVLFKLRQMWFLSVLSGRGVKLEKLGGSNET